MISIHVPLAGSDDKVSNELRDLWISIHVPLVGSDGKAGLYFVKSVFRV